ncbi:lysophospholipase [Nocardia sp. NEAU-G5]|uniref:Lysophospholipase n=1 Tax=Nocardia albiluteola TaxID=2842303 RepID=A0ABS6B3S9_9NOCA|nr:lysophospholipase [Nocardia albiluteola]MBU3064425.1 lysophospholipase [Nocardia albiluteola]
MDVTSEAMSGGVIERLFTVGDVRGIVWSPTGATSARPLILLGHGGGQHKSSEALVARARRYVTDGGFVVAAIDAPGHGARPQTERGRQLLAAIRENAADGVTRASDVRRYNTELAAQVVPEWQVALDALLTLGDVAEPVGYWGVSLGTALGVRLLAAEPRISAAVLGLAHGQALLALAASITIPIEFLLQWDDEVVPRDAGLALFDAFASAEKTLHANPGRHNETPSFEVESSRCFFARHLLTPVVFGVDR